MSEINSEMHLIEVTKDRLLHFLKTAQRRILIAKPGYLEDEIETILGLITSHQVECNVYVDPDEAVVRYGFGEATALKMAMDNVDVLKLQTIHGIRLSVVIVDDKALIFTPAALSWEEEPKELVYPNGLEGGKALVDQLLAQFKTTGSEQSLPRNVTAFATVTIQEIQKVVTEQNLTQTIEALEKNPPIDPSILRQVNIYRNFYKLLKMQIKGAKIKNKSLDLRQFNKMFPDTNERLKTSWVVFTKNDVDNLMLPKKFYALISKIEQKCTFDAGRFGTLIKTPDKEHFERNIERAKKAFISAMTKNIKKDSLLLKENSNQPKDMQQKEPDSIKADEKIPISLAGLLYHSRKSLIDYLCNVALQQKQYWEALFSDNRALYGMLLNKKIDEYEALHMVTENFVDYRLRFPGADEMIEAIDVKLDYYDISNELLDDPEFKEILDGFDLKVREYTKGFEKQNN